MISTRQQQLFRQLSPLRYRSPLLYPKLCWSFLLNYRRDKKVLAQGIQEIIASAGEGLPPEVLTTYLNTVILFNYALKADIRFFTMLKPPLMECLAEQSARVIQEKVPGALVDVGVWRGGTSMIMKTAVEEAGADREVICLDLFDLMDEKALSDEDPTGDKGVIAALELARKHFQTEGVTTSIETVRRNFGTLGVKVEGVRFIKGDLTDPAFPFHEVSGPIAVLRIDCDFYTATRRTLDALYPLVSSGGAIILDDYHLEAFGERQATDEYRAAHGITAPLQQIGASAMWIKP